MSDLAIRVNNISKLYHIGAKQKRHDTLRDSIMSAFEAPKRWFGRNGQAAEEDLWALKDVSFEVKHGEVVGIIGRNGAGKSTLLKILSRITKPTTGSIEMHGRIASLLEVGTGFHPELTGRENIYLNGAILGMRRAEIDRKFDEIVAFAEIEKFLDTPVKRYSSGMYVRLAFAVAAHLEPEILIVDEVLAVGDAEFQKKCLGKMGDVAKEGRTVLFVSHNMHAVTALCHWAIQLNKGMIVRRANALEVVEQYLGETLNEVARTEWRGSEGDENVSLRKTMITTQNGSPFTTDEEVNIVIELEVLREVYALVVAVEIWNVRQQLLAYTAQDDKESPPSQVLRPGVYEWQLTIPPNTFAEGTYIIRFDVGLHFRKRIIDGQGTLRVDLHNTSGIGRRYGSNVWTNLVRPDWKWKCAITET